MALSCHSLVNGPFMLRTRKESERRALLSCVGWLASFENLMFKHGVLVERGCPVLSVVQLCCANSLECWKEECTSFRERVGYSR